MIIGRTPYRISFFGGGTDYPSWYREHGGAVLSTTIDKYCYISARYLPPFFSHTTRLVYSKIELVKSTAEIQHPSAQAVLNFLNLNHGLEIHHDGDLPARSGIGSSSSFTVGLLHALSTLKGLNLYKEELARQSIYIEQEIIKENVGSQDQTAAAFGGFNLIEFVSTPGQQSGQLSGQIDDILVRPLGHLKALKELQKHLLLVYLGTSRNSSEVAKHLIQSLDEKKDSLKALYQMVWEAKKILESGRDISEFGKLLHESWQIKKALSPYVSLDYIDRFYDFARKLGATGGKLLGAGGGGFFLLFVPPEKQAHILSNLGPNLSVPFQFESTGAQIIFKQDNMIIKDEYASTPFDEKQYQH